jgi:hypothetical protein
MCCICNNRRKTTRDCHRGGEGEIHQMYSLAEEEVHAVKILTPWEKDLEMLEDWLNNPEPEDGFQETIMHIVGEEHST